MPTKSQIPWLLAALVLAAYTHCVYSHAIEAADRHDKLCSDAEPIDDTRATCENESACICKGATLAIGASVSAPELNLVDAVCPESAAEFLVRVTDSSDRRALPDHDEPPITGRVLRAQLQCFLL